MRGENLGEALLAIVRGRGAHGSFELEDVDGCFRVRELPDDPARGLAAFLDEVGADEADVERWIRRHGAVRQDHGNARGHGFVQHRVPARLDDRRERDDVHVLRDERAQRLDLVFLFLLRVGEAQVDVVNRGSRLDRFGVRGTPFALGADLAESEHDALVLRPLAAGREHEQT
jgi:hypothetical protein